MGCCQQHCGSNIISDMRFYMTTRVLMLVVIELMKRKVRKKGRVGGGPSGRDKQEETKLVYGSNDMAIRYMNKAKEEKNKADGNTDASNKLTSTINTNISADPTSDVQFKPPQELGEGLVKEKTTAVSHIPALPFQKCLILRDTMQWRK